MEITPLENAKVLWKLKIKVVKAMFAIKKSVGEEMLEHIKHTKGSMDTFARLFSIYMCERERERGY